MASMVSAVAPMTSDPSGIPSFLIEACGAALLLLFLAITLYLEDE